MSASSHKQVQLDHNLRKIIGLDIDYIFQSSFQLFNQSSGGWPLTMFLDENGAPFMGGTYFPKNSQHGLPSFQTVLTKVNEAYKENRENIIKQKNLIVKNGEVSRSYSETRTKKYMNGDEILIDINLGLGKGESDIWTCDLTEGYIRINADYRS